MAIEIKELLIKATVDNSEANSSAVLQPESNNQLLLEQCVAQSVEQVLRILERERKR